MANQSRITHYSLTLLTSNKAAIQLIERLTRELKLPATSRPYYQ
jgi:hypothetical protein